MNTAALSADQGRAIWAVGILHTFLATGEDTGGAYAMMHVMVPPQVGPPPHQHQRENEAFYLLEGKMLFHADGRDYEGKPGTWIMLPRGGQHFFKNIGTSPAKMLVVISPAGLERFFVEIGQEATGGPAPPVTPADIEKLLAAAPRYGLEIAPLG
jgi:quercetin dioxygenase-like cupin family protein